MSTHDTTPDDGAPLGTSPDDAPLGTGPDDDPGVPGPGVAAPLFTAHLEEGLDAALRDFAAAPNVLVGLDFDGVLAPLVLDPSTSRVLPQSAAAIADLSGLPGVTVAVVSGREAATLTALADVPAGTRIIGSHGAQWGTVVAGPGGRELRAEPVALTEAQAALRAQLVRETTAIVDDVPGAHVEAKPAAAVLHTRGAARPDAERLTQAALEGPATLPGVHVVVGKEVVEMSVLGVTKGDALVQLRTDLAVDAVLYAGDDTTDEDAFAVLGEGDLGVKVGAGETAAAYRVTDPEEFSVVLMRLVALRSGTLDASL